MLKNVLPDRDRVDASAKKNRSRKRAERRMKKESAGKPGSVVDSHSSRRRVAAALEQPTRERRGPRHCSPMWSCSRWGLPCRSVARLAVRSYRTVSPLPRIPPPLCRPLCILLDTDLAARATRSTSSPAAWRHRGDGIVRRFALCCTIRRLTPPRRYLAPCPVEPGLSSAPLRMTRLSGRLRA